MLKSEFGVKNASVAMGYPEPSRRASRGRGIYRDSYTIAAVIVTYNPKAGELERLTSALLHQVSQILVVDNGSREDVTKLLGDAPGIVAECLRLGKNVGVAAALNRGVTWARHSGADCVILFDQDSVPASDMVKRLSVELSRLQDAGIRVAAVGPRFWDPRADNPPPFIQIRHGRVVRVAEQRGHPVVEVDYLITSGSLIPIKTFDHVGLLEERLFVDYVDVEWGLRAKREGFRCFGVFPAKMQHSLGETPLRLVGARLPVHSALRHYYHFRNAIWLTRQAWVPLRWKFVNGYRLIGKFLIYSFLATPRLEHLRMMAKGVWHGFSDQLGQYT